MGEFEGKHYYDRHYISEEEHNVKKKMSKEIKHDSKKEKAFQTFQVLSAASVNKVFSLFDFVLEKC